MKKMKKRKPGKIKREPELCENCAAIYRKYIDLSLDEEYRLDLIAKLLMESRAEFTPDTADEVGTAIDSFLQKKLAREFVFFGRSLKRCTLAEMDLKAELQRARLYKKELTADK